MTLQHETYPPTRVAQDAFRCSQIEKRGGLHEHGLDTEPNLYLRHGDQPNFACRARGTLLLWNCGLTKKEYSLLQTLLERG